MKHIFVDLNSMRLGASALASTMAVVLLSGCPNLLGSGATNSTATPGFAPALPAMPTPFSLLNLTPRDSAATVTFASSVLATSYNIYYRLSGSPSFIQIPGVTSPYTITSLTNNLAYNVYVEAMNARGSTITTTGSVTPAIQSNQLFEIVGGSTKLAVTGGGYKVHASVASPTEGLAGTTVHGYKTQLNVEGIIDATMQ